MKQGVLFLCCTFLLASFVSAEVCDGCMRNGLCVPYGTRDVGTYCSFDGVFYPQLLTNATSHPSCDNDYQCTSNSCSSGRCVDVQGELTADVQSNSLLGSVLCKLAHPFNVSAYRACLGIAQVNDTLPLTEQFLTEYNESIMESARFIAPRPVLLTARSVSSLAISLSWANATKSERSLQVYRSLYPDRAFSLLAFVSPYGSSYVDTGLVPNTTYYYFVQSRFASGVLNSSVVNVSTLSFIAPNASVLASPTSVSASSSSDAIIISWSYDDTV